MEEAMRESEEKYRDLAENAADMQLLMDLRGNLTYMSKSAEDETGYTREEIVGRSIRELLTQESYKIAVERIKKRVEGIKELPIYEVEVKAKDGRIIPFELNTSPVIKDGKLTAIHIVARNITERKRAEEETKYQRTYFQSLFNDSPEAIVSLDERFRVININPAFHEIFGYSLEEIKGKNIDDCILPEEKEAEGRMLSERVVNGENVAIESIRTTKDGKEIPVSILGAPILINGRQVGIFAIYRDITERKKMEEELRKKKTEVEAINKELEDYTYAVSHELQAPLRSIKAFSDFLLEDYDEKLDERSKDYLNRLKNASTRMGNLIDDLLALSRVGGKMELEKVDLNELLQEVKDELIVQEKNAELKIESLPTINCNKLLMKQLFENLIDNGIKFNEKKPEIEIRCDERKEKDQYVFSVKDNGIGIENKYLEKIFDVFERLHPLDKYGGTGAGLAICKKIVDRHGGKIWAESKLGEGSTFYFTIPKIIH